VSGISQVQAVSSIIHSVPIIPKEASLYLPDVNPEEQKNRRDQVPHQADLKSRFCCHDSQDDRPQRSYGIRHCEFEGEKHLERAEMLIGIAHPDHREGLIKEAEEMVSGEEARRVHNNYQ